MESLEPPEKPLERSASSAGISTPKRREGDDEGTSGARPRAHTGSRTPRMFGLGVPAEKVTTGRSLERRESTHCLLPPDTQVPLLPTSVPGSGIATPSIVLTPAPDNYVENDILSLASSIVSDNSNLSALREDIPSPPLDAMTPASVSPDNAEGRSYQSILTQSRARSRRATISTEKSVNFEEPPKTAEAIEETPAILEEDPQQHNLEVKTVQFDDPDPTFHRSIKSPLEPKDEAYVEQIGSFRVAYLRNDSLGNLPKILTESEEGSPSSERVAGEGTECFEDGLGVSEDGGSVSQDDLLSGDEEAAEVPVPKPAQITLRRPSVEQPALNVPVSKLKVDAEDASINVGEAVDHSLEPEPPIALPPMAKTQEEAGGKRRPIPPGFRNPNSVLPTGATGTTAVCSEHIHQEQPIITSPFDRSMATVASMSNPFDSMSAEGLGRILQPGTGEGSTVDGKWVRRKGSVAASIRSVHEILWKDDSLKPTPQPTPVTSRRSSAWAVGRGSLGLSLDPWSGSVQSSSG
ncbi:hypothetical protein K440DRAFT_671640 [Wilcoxina mikolae CBS 423.85]|nr:hypothetical protein K440DRAFT_671640 [Wilcoxina mikolae CBS 423.85]